MSGFGTLQDMDALMKCTESIQEQELIEIKNTPEQEEKLVNVTIPVMESEGSWKDLVKKGGTKMKAIVESGDVVKKKPEEGAAGNAEKGGKEKEPLMGSMGNMGVKLSLGSASIGSPSIAPELEKKGLEENFGSNVTDEDPTKEALHRTNANKVVGKAKEMFDEMYGSSFGKQKEYAFDSTKDCGTKLSKEPISKMPKGW